jgi:hypothetical protein
MERWAEAADVWRNSGSEQSVGNSWKSPAERTTFCQWLVRVVPPAVRHPPFIDDQEGRMMRLATSCLCLGIATLLFTSPAHPAWKGSEKTVDGVLEVHNPAQPAAGELALEPEELFSLGGESENEHELFGLVQQILVDDDHNSYLLDQQLSEIPVFDAEGNYLRTIGREGEGPGEFKNPSNIFFLPNGHLGVSQMMPGRVAVLDRQGEGYEDLPLPGKNGFAMVSQVELAGDRVVMQQTVGSFSEGKVTNTTRLVALDGKGKELAVYGEKSRDMDVSGGRMVISMGDNEFARVWTAAADGRVFVVNHYTGYRIEVYGPDGKIERVILRDYEPLPYTQEEKDRRQKRFESRPKTPGLNLEPHFPDLKPDITALYARPNGELWVRTSRSSGEDKSLGSFDVFDAQGHFQRVVRPKIRYDDGRDGYVITKDRLYRIKELNGALKAWAAGFGGGIRIAIQNDAEEDEEEGEPQPLEIVAFRLPTALGNEAR